MDKGKIGKDLIRFLRTLSYDTSNEIENEV